MARIQSGFLLPATLAVSIPKDVRTLPGPAAPPAKDPPRPGLNRSGTGHDLWPLVIAQVTGLIAVGLIAVVSRDLKPPPPRASWLAILAGVTGAAGTACYFVATHEGLLAVSAVITSLYPGSTILLARVLLGERLTRTRLAGLGLAATSVALIAVGGSG